MDLIYDSIGDFHELEVAKINARRKLGGLVPLTLDESDAIRRQAARVIESGQMVEQFYEGVNDTLSPGPKFMPTVGISDGSTAADVYNSGLGAAEAERRAAAAAVGDAHAEELARRKLEALARAEAPALPKEGLTQKVLKGVDKVMKSKPIKMAEAISDKVLNFEEIAGQFMDDAVGKLGPLGEKIAKAGVGKGAAKIVGTIPGQMAMDVVPFPRFWPDEYSGKKSVLQDPSLLFDFSENGGWDKGQIVDQISAVTNPRLTQKEKDYGTPDVYGLRPGIDFILDYTGFSGRGEGFSDAKRHLRTTLNDPEYRELSDGGFIKSMVRDYYYEPLSRGAPGTPGGFALGVMEPVVRSAVGGAKEVGRKAAEWWNDKDEEEGD